MKIKIVESRNAPAAAMTVSTNGSYGNQSGAPRRFALQTLDLSLSVNFIS